MKAHKTACLLGGLVLLAAILWVRPWVGEDVHITLRTVENFVDGYGLRWSIDERVQTYTHPLWLFVLITLYVFHHDIYWTVTALSIALSIAAVLLHARRVHAGVVLLMVAMYCSSLALLDFSTSGFENPLTLFLVSLFIDALLRDGEPAWGELSLIAALAMLNRLDAAVLLAPVFLYLVVRERPGVRSFTKMALGFLPLVAWLLFSLFYYGTFVPNTAPAKLSSNVDTMSYVHTGVRDLVLLLRNDPGGGVLLVLGMLAAGRALVVFARRRGARAGALAALGVGFFLQIAYTIRVGGDFIIGRFWTTQLFVALLLVAYQAEDVWRTWRASRFLGLVVAVAAIELVLLVGIGRFYVGPHAFRKWGGDGATYRSYARAELQRDLTWKLSDGALVFQKEGIDAKQRLAEKGERVLVTQTVGFAGLAAGRDVMIVDPFALADPLLSHLPSARHELWLSGHVRRVVPRGYVHARETGSLDEMEPAMRTYYEAVRLVTRGPLFNAERLRAIVALNLHTIVPPAAYAPDPATLPR